MNLASIDRGLYQILRDKLIEANLSVDKRLYTTQQEYDTAKAALREIRPDKTIVDIFGVGSPESRDEKTDSKITIDRKSIKPSNLGGFPEIKYEKITDTNNDLDNDFGGGGAYNKYMMPDNAYDIDYEVRIITTSTSMDRVLHDIVFSALGSKKYLKNVDEDGTYLQENFLTLYAGNVDMTYGNFIERVFRYTVEQVWLTECTVLQADIPELTTNEATAVVQPIVTLPDA